jgi:hypothetical protein
MPQAPLPRDPDTAAAIRTSRTRLSVPALRQLRAEMFRQQLQALEDILVAGVDAARVADVGHYAMAIAAVDMLQGTTHERQR